MSIATETTIHLFITPKALRELADTMERAMKFKHLGEDCTIYTVFTGTHTLKFVADQTEWNKHIYKLEGANWI